VTRAPVLAEVAGSPFGPRLQATMAMLTSTYGLSRRNVVALLKYLFDIDISLGALQGACEKVSAAESAGGKVSEIGGIKVSGVRRRADGGVVQDSARTEGCRESRRPT
jgi:hypothetical protein